MPRRSLRPELNKIRGWVRQGRTDAWIAHQLEVPVQQIQAFKREQELEPSVPGDASISIVDFDDEIDLRAEDDALIAAELDAQAQAAQEASEAAEEAEGEKPKRRRNRRGGRTTTRARRKLAGPLEATFDHGEEGYGLWLDPAVVDDPIYAEYWAGHRPVEVTIEEDQIIIRRAGGEESESDSDELESGAQAEPAADAEASTESATAERDAEGGVESDAESEVEDEDDDGESNAAEDEDDGARDQDDDERDPDDDAQDDSE